MFLDLWDAALKLAVGVPSFYLGFQTLTVKAVADRRNKSIDIISRLSERFDRIKHDAEAPLEALQHDHAIFRQYWGLQNDQFDFWLAGFVDPETISEWVYSCAIRLGSHQVFVDSWKEYEKIYNSPDPIFSRTVNLISKLGSKDNYKGDEYYTAILDILIDVEASESAFMRMHHKSYFAMWLLRHTTIRKYKKIYLRNQYKNLSKRRLLPS